MEKNEQETPRTLFSFNLAFTKSWLQHSCCFYMCYLYLEKMYGSRVIISTLTRTKLQAEASNNNKDVYVSY